VPLREAHAGSVAAQAWSLTTQAGSLAVHAGSLAAHFGDQDQLDRLLVRTIGFLIQSENISPTLRADARILTEIYKKIFGRAPDLRRATKVSSQKKK
jgi:hypothetical protein